MAVPLSNHVSAEFAGGISHSLHHCDVKLGVTMGNQDMPEKQR